VSMTTPTYPPSKPDPTKQTRLSFIYSEKLRDVYGQGGMVRTHLSPAARRAGARRPSRLPPPSHNRDASSPTAGVRPSSPTPLLLSVVLTTGAQW
jgi:hypothetical protein